MEPSSSFSIEETLLLVADVIRTEQAVKVKVLLKLAPKKVGRGYLCLTI